MLEAIRSGAAAATQSAPKLSAGQHGGPAPAASSPAAHTDSASFSPEAMKALEAEQG